VGRCGLVVAGGDAAPLLEAVEAPLDDVAPLVDLLVEDRRASAMAAASNPVANLVGTFRDGVADVALPRPGAYGLGAVALVTDDVVGSEAALGPSWGARIASNTAVNWVQSLVFPPVTVKAIGRPRASQARWILLVRPTLDQPSSGLRSPPFFALRSSFENVCCSAV
jgi:hypothetical protein